ncbi:hypothetical protein BKH43_06925 [Helicobacter sp. 13S00401-1]|uniref:hypothetical protein n=1 Tax=Helicobacter sp. 13S00401-1 TaxID=1905758 RepID=UPI000BA7A772|nr:hypothetical protein [Helicobacter sp. 13S00401-1]PAF49308.1 hypothetical protein BKH43_06925 [Helicobacter sp. 13S00401-1]
MLMFLLTVIVAIAMLVVAFIVIGFFIGIMYLPINPYKPEKITYPKPTKKPKRVRAELTFKGEFIQMKKEWKEANQDWRDTPLIGKIIHVIAVSFILFCVFGFIYYLFT